MNQPCLISPYNYHKWLAISSHHPQKRAFPRAFRLSARSCYDQRPRSDGELGVPGPGPRPRARARAGPGGDLHDLHDLGASGATGAGDETHPAARNEWGQWGGGRYLEQSSKSGQSSPQCLERTCGRGGRGLVTGDFDALKYVCFGGGVQVNWFKLFTQPSQCIQRILPRLPPA